MANTETAALAATFLSMGLGPERSATAINALTRDLALPDGLQWTDRHDWSPVAQEAVRTLSGAQVVFCAALSGGRPVTLEAEDGVAWLDQSMVDTLSAMAAQPGAVFLLEWDGETMSVMFRHQEPPVLSVTPLWPHYTLFTGSIRLMAV